MGLERLTRPAWWLLVVVAACGAVPVASNLPVAVTAQGGANRVELSLGRSVVVTAPWPVKNVSVANPEVADVQITSATQMIVLSKGVGVTDLILRGESDQTWQAAIIVQPNMSEFEVSLAQLLPDTQLRVGQINDVLSISGTLRRADDARILHALLAATGKKFVDATKVEGLQQVMLNVRFAEASRTAIRALAINSYYNGDNFFGASTIGGNPNGFNFGTGGIDLEDSALSTAVTLFGGFKHSDFAMFIAALADNQYIRTLAEPTLVAQSGEEASFLAGGEFPIPVVQGGTGGGSTSVTIEWKEYGVRLNFRPVVKGEGQIELYVAPEVSTLTDVGSVELEGFRIPALTTRRAETTLQLGNGQTFAMAGLLNQNVTGRTARVPGIGDLPVIGSLFRSIRYERGDTELVVLVTVYLVDPVSGRPIEPLPGDMHEDPNDWQLYAEGKIEGRVMPVSQGQIEQLKRMGLADLQGPGAWADYRTKPAAAAKDVAVAPAAPPAPQTPASDRQPPSSSPQAPADSGAPAPVTEGQAPPAAATIDESAGFEPAAEPVPDVESAAPAADSDFAVPTDAAGQEDASPVVEQTEDVGLPLVEDESSTPTVDDAYPAEDK